MTTEHCLTKLREGLSSKNMLDVVCGLDRDLLHDTIYQYASPSLLREFLDTPYLDLLSPYSRGILGETIKLMAVFNSFNDRGGSARITLTRCILVSIMYRIFCENVQFMLSHRNFAQTIYNKLDFFNSFSELRTWVDQVRILFNQIGIGPAPQQLNTAYDEVNAESDTDTDTSSDDEVNAEFVTNMTSDADQRRVLIYEPSISRIPECIVSAIINSKKTCPCCFDELTIPTTIVMTSCCWDCYCIDCVRKLHSPICPSCRTPFDFHVAQM